jgi:hypothetical protein
MKSRKFVKLGPYRLFREENSDDWYGPEKGGDVLSLHRKVDKDNKDWVAWELYVHGECSGFVDLSWCGCALEKSPKVAAKMAWEFIKRCHKIKKGVGSWLPAAE